MRSQPVDHDLGVALEALALAKRSSMEIQPWCEEVGSVNQFCPVAFFRKLLQMPPTKFLENAYIGISVLKMCARLDVPGSFRIEWQIVKSHMDAVLLRTLTAFKAEEQNTSNWWADQKSFAQLILLQQSLEKVLAVETDWKDVSTDVEAVFESSLVRKHIMARAMLMLELEVVDTKVSELMDELLEADVINKKLVDELKKKFIDSMKAKGDEVQKDYTLRKSAKISYRRAIFEVIVMSPMDHFNLAVECDSRSCCSQGVAAEALARGFAGKRRCHGSSHEGGRGPAFWCC